MAARHFPPSVLTNHSTLNRLPTKPQLPPREMLWSPQHLRRRVAHERARHREHPLLPTHPWELALLAAADPATKCILLKRLAVLANPYCELPEQATISSRCSHPMIVSPFRVLPTTSTFERFTRSERPESVARTPIRSPLGG